MNYKTKLGRLDWEEIEQSLDKIGYALTPTVFKSSECAALSSFYDKPDLFRSTINMARYGFGEGEYKYFSYPLPSVIQMLRKELYKNLFPIANEWAERLGNEYRWPSNYTDFLKICWEAEQTRPTPLMLNYGKGDYNCLHQDLYGKVHFPLQALVLLSAEGKDFEGGSLTLVENRPRMQSRCEVPPLRQGQILFFPVRDRPRLSSRGYSRAIMRHGVSTVTRGQRRTLGLIFHDAA